MRIPGTCSSAAAAGRKVKAGRQPEKRIYAGKWMSSADLQLEIEEGYRRFCARRGLPYNRRER